MNLFMLLSLPLPRGFKDLLACFRRTLVISACIAFLPFVAGCNGLLPDARLAGTYLSAGGDRLEIEADGMMSREIKSSEQPREYLGFGRIIQAKPLVIEIFAPDTSRWLGTQLEFTPTFNAAAVTWRSFSKDVSEPPQTFLRQ
jgi:hypothetical protein